MNRKEFLLKVLGKKYYEINEIDLNYLVSDKGWNSIFATLTHKERYVIEQRIEEKTLQEIGNEFDLTRERIRQIEHKVERRLKLRIDTLIKADLTKQAISIREEMITEINRNKYLLGKLKEKNVSLIKELGADVDVAEFDVLDKPIEELQLSVRTYNCLIRAGFKTFKDLTMTSYDQLIRVRNLGRKSAQEVIDLVKSYGYELPKESELNIDIYGHIKRDNDIHEEW